MVASTFRRRHCSIILRSSRSQCIWQTLRVETKLVVGIPLRLINSRCLVQVEVVSRSHNMAPSLPPRLAPKTRCGLYRCERSLQTRPFPASDGRPKHTRHNHLQLMDLLRASSSSALTRGPLECRLSKPSRWTHNSRGCSASGTAFCAKTKIPAHGCHHETRFWVRMSSWQSACKSVAFARVSSIPFRQPARQLPLQLVASRMRWVLWDRAIQSTPRARPRWRRYMLVS